MLCRVHHIPIKNFLESAKNGSLENTKVLSFPSGLEFHPERADFVSGIVNIGGVPVFIMVLSEELPTAGDYVYSKIYNKIGRVKEVLDERFLLIQFEDTTDRYNHRSAHKIIATNARSFPSAYAPAGFLREYAESNGTLNHIKVIRGVTVNNTVIIQKEDVYA